MRTLPKPKHKQALLYLVLIVITASVAIGLRRCVQRNSFSDKPQQQLITDEDSVRYIPVNILND